MHKVKAGSMKTGSNLLVNNVIQCALFEYFCRGPSKVSCSIKQDLGINNCCATSDC